MAYWHILKIDLKWQLRQHLLKDVLHLMKNRKHYSISGSLNKNRSKFYAFKNENAFTNQQESSHLDLSEALIIELYPTTKPASS